MNQYCYAIYKPFSHSLPFFFLSILQNSEKPQYRISSLEGQLRLYQGKLAEALHKHSAELASQQVAHEEKLTQLREEHEAELKEAHRRIEELEKQSSTGSSSSMSPKPAVTITRTPASPTPPPLMLMSRHRYKRRSDGLANTSSSTSSSSSKLIEVKMTEALNVEENKDGRQSRLGSRDRIKSASDNNLSTKGLEDEETQKPFNKNSHEQRLSSDVASEATKELACKDSSERLTITDLFEQSLSNPSSMSTIRREMKLDGFTPKIRRKFHGSPSNSAKLTSAKLPSVSPKSGLIQDSRNGDITFGKEVLGKRDTN